MNYSVAPLLPLVGIPACARQLGHHPFHIAGDKYIRAVSDGAGALPLVIPAALDLPAPGGANLATPGR